MVGLEICSTVILVCKRHYNGYELFGFDQCLEVTNVEIELLFGNNTIFDVHRLLRCTTFKIFRPDNLFLCLLHSETKILYYCVYFRCIMAFNVILMF